MRVKILFLIFCATTIISCTNNPVNSNKNSFALNVQVVDSHNNPLKNINVSIWPKTNIDYLLKSTSQSKAPTTTIIEVALPKKCFVSMIMYNLDNKIVNKAISREFQAGTYSYHWTTPIRNGVFKCKLITSSDSLENNVFFQDSIYVAAIAHVASISSIGKTDTNGRIATSDKLLFPNLYKLPSITRTSEDGSVTGIFTFSDSVTVALSDGSFSNVKLYSCKIINANNKIKLNWDDGVLQSMNQNTFERNKFTANKLSTNSASLPKYWRLSQNYPNPF